MAVIPIDIVKMAAVGVLIEEGMSEEDARVILEHDYDLSKAPAYIQKAIRKTASVILTLQAHGLIKESVH